jgi:hypothetical protein
MAAPAHEGGDNTWSIIIAILVIVFLGVVVYGLSAPFNPTYINIEFIFARMLDVFQSVFSWFVTYQAGSTIVLIVGLICIFLIGLCFYLFLRLLEIEKEHEDHVYHHAHDEHGEKPKSLIYQVMSDFGELAGDTGGLVHKSTIGVVDTAAEAFDKVLFRDESDLAKRSHVAVPGVKRTEEEKEGTYKWKMVLKHISSKNPSDWKLAIIEADTILDVLVERAGFPGPTLGERMKNADPGIFRTLKFARDAHGVRNRIAHEGSSFTLSERDAKRTIQEYEEVFKEFDYI